MPRTTLPPMIGETPTTGAGACGGASRMPGTDTIVPIETTGFDGATSTRSAPTMASTTPGAGVARSIFRCRNAMAGNAAR